MHGKTILIIDDEPHINQLVNEVLSSEGAQVHTATSGEEGLRQFYQHRPDLVIIDLMMPDIDGWETARRIQQLAQVPIVMLTSLGDEENIVRGLNAGAVDYVTKPFSPKVLVARIRAALRQAMATDGPAARMSYEDDYLAIDLQEHRVLVSGQPIKLTKTEYGMLAYLVQNAGRVLTFEQILENVWGWEYQESIEYVHVYASRLRQKLERDPKQPRYLLSEYGIGYRFRRRPAP